MNKTIKKAISLLLAFIIFSSGSFANISLVLAAQADRNSEIEIYQDEDIDSLQEELEDEEIEGLETEEDLNNQQDNAEDEDISQQEDIDDLEDVTDDTTNDISQQEDNTENEANQDEDDAEDQLEDFNNNQDHSIENETINRSARGLEQGFYGISTAEDLINIKNDLSGTYVLLNDIDLNNEIWIPINNFTGSIDGQGFRVKNVKISGNYSSLFQTIRGATIKNLIIENIDLNNSYYQSGVIAANSYNSIIENCAVTGIGEIKYPSYPHAFGGIVGYAENTTIEKCFVTVKITSSSATAGGIAGQIKGSVIRDCFVVNNVHGNNNSGGLVGIADNSEIENCYFAGVLYLSSLFEQRLIGSSINNSKVTNSYFDLTISRKGLYQQNEQAKTTSELTKKETYQNWNFNSIWKFTGNYLYPSLSTMPFDFEGVNEEIAGTISNPYKIKTVEDFNNIRNDLEGFYTLENDINLNNQSWTPINNFIGSINGQGFRVKNVKISGNYASLFQTIRGATIKNLIIENIDLNNSYYQSGVIAANSYNSIIENCAVTGIGEIKYPSYPHAFGGIVGYAENTTIEKCFVTVKITSSSATAGGIAGQIKGSLIRDCFVVNNVHGNNNSGGLVGVADNSEIENCYFAGVLYLSSLFEQRLIGSSINNSKVTNSYFDLTISRKGLYQQNEQAKTTSELTKKETYQNWNFNSIWKFTGNYLYPSLSTMPFDFEGVNEEIAGTISNPYKIKTVEDFNNIRNDLEGFYTLENDIDLNNQSWTPINNFIGSINGQGFRVKNVKISGNYTSLFQTIRGATIKNLIIENIDLNNSYFQSGVIAASSYNSIIENCAVTGIGEIKYPSYPHAFGGIVGYAENTTIEKCFVTVKITSSSATAGGIAGQIKGSVIRDCFVANNVHGNNNSGGLVGIVDNSVIENCYFAGVLYLSSLFEQRLVGSSINNSKVTNSYFDLTISRKGLYQQNEQAKTTSELTKKETYQNWNFNNIWKFTGGYLYPSLSTTSFDFEGVNEEIAGTISNPYKIKTAEDFNNIRNDLEGFYVLENDIDLNNQSWTPINNFIGYINGQGNRVKNVKISGNYASLFQTIRGATIKNLIIENIDLNNSYFQSGVIAASSYNSIIENCAVTGIGEIKYPSYPHAFGGIVGYAENTTIEKCFVTVKVTSSSATAGGIAGQIKGSVIKDCFVANDIKGNNNSGGLVGIADNSVIENCYFAGTLYLSSQFEQRLIGSSANAAIVTNSYFDLSLANNGVYQQNEQAKTTEQLKQQSTYVNWDFINVWSMSEGEGYPGLRALSEQGGNGGGNGGTTDSTIAIYGVTPKSGSSIGTNAQFNITAYSGSELSKVYAEYKNGDSWAEIGNVSASGRGYLARITWDNTSIANGQKELRFYAVDKQGNRSEYLYANYLLTNEVITVPNLIATPGGMNINLKWDITTGNKNYFLYKMQDDKSILLGKFDDKTDEYTDNFLDPTKSYTYYLEVQTASGGVKKGENKTATPLNFDSYKPKSDIGFDFKTVVGYGNIFDGTNSSDNIGIVSYEWDFGDGTKASGHKVNHAFDSVGSYKVSLTVKDSAGNTDTSSITVSVLNDTDMGTVRVTIMDKATSQKIPFAYLYLTDGNTYANFRADSNGEIVINETYGIYSLSAFSNDYLPKTEEIEIQKNAGSQITIYLDRSKIVNGDIVTKQLTTEEIIEAGIDVNDPDNNFVYKFEITLEFDGEKLPEISCTTNGSGTVVGGGGGSYGSSWGGSGKWGGTGGTYYPQFIPSGVPNVPPSLVILKIPAKLMYLKEMFEVSLIVQNLSPEEFVITDNISKINLPNGLSLVSGIDTNQQIPDIKGGEAGVFKWIVKGDKEGSYNFTADYSGLLTPFSAAINAIFSNADPITVSNTDGLEIDVYAEPYGIDGHPYYVQFIVTNNSDVPRNYLKLTVGDEADRTDDIPITMVDPVTGTKTQLDPYSKNYVLNRYSRSAGLPLIRPGDSFVVDVLEPGESITGNYVVMFEGADDYYYKLTNMFYDEADGNTLNVKVNLHIKPGYMKYPVTTRCNTESFLTFSYGNSDYKSNFNQNGEDSENEENLFGFFNPLTSLFSAVGAGENNLFENLTKSDTLYGAGGWYSELDFRVEEDYDDAIKLFRSNEDYVRFENVNLREGVFYGQQTGNDIEVLEGPDSGKFSTAVSGFEQERMTKNSDGTYEFVTAGNITYSFDANGQLEKIKDVNNKTSVITREADRLIVTEEGKTKSLVLELDSFGRVIKETTPNGEVTLRSYNADGLASSITDNLGNVTSYEYDSKNRISKISNATGFVIYEYDEDNRVIKETDPMGYSVTHEYKDPETVGFVTVTTTDRNGNKTIKETNAFGRVYKITYANGTVANLTYDKDGNLTSVKTGTGKEIINEYNEDNSRISITDPLGVKVSMDYDENKNLISSTLPNGATTTHSYDIFNQLIKTTATNGLEANYTYDNDGNVTSKTIGGLGTEFYTYENGLLKTTTDVDGNVTVIDYNSLNLPVKITNQDGNTIRFNYDGKNRISETVDPKGGVTRFDYDERNNIIKITDAKGVSVTKTYDLNNRLISETNALSDTVSYEYDREGGLLKVNYPKGESVSYKYDSVYNLTEVIDVDGNSTKYYYNENNQLATSVFPNGATIERTYYENGLVRTIKGATGSVTTYYYDGVNRLEKVVDVLGREQKYVYDISGNLIKTIYASGNDIQIEYDLYGRRVSTTDLNGNTTRYTYTNKHQVSTITDALGNTTKMYYNDNGQLVKTVNPRNAETKMEYDQNGNLVKLTNALNQSVTMNYDVLGNVTSVIDSKGNVVENLEYDVLGRLVKVTDALGNSSQVVYDGSYSNVLQSIDALNNQTSYDYDRQGRLVKQTDAEGGVVKYGYDVMGNLSSFTDQNGGVTAYKYDIAGRLIEEDMSIGGKRTYAYDSLSNLVKFVNGNGQQFDYIYDFDSQRLKEVEGTSYTYDNNGNILTVTNDEGTTTRTYDALNRVTTFTDVYGNTIKYDYDEASNLIKLTYPDGEAVNYEYNLLNQLVKVIDYRSRITHYEYDENGLLIKTSLPDGTSEINVYDEKYQLIETKTVLKNGTESSVYYTYDAKGKITSETLPDVSSLLDDNNTTMTYKAGNQIDTYNGQKIFYDGEGNMTKGPLNGVMTDYQYDMFNTLTNVDGTSYYYDGEGTRIRQQDGSGITTYVTDPNAYLSKLLVKNNPDGTKEIYVYGLGLISQETVDATDDFKDYRVYHYDYRGSTIALTDRDGNFTDTFGYGTYGELVSRTGNTKTPFLYVGKYGVQTDDNGLLYMRARYYNVDVKRFVNIDPIRDGVNWYGYVGGDPVGFVDPRGEAPILVVLAFVLVAELIILDEVTPRLDNPMVRVDSATLKIDNTNVTGGKWTYEENSEVDIESNKKVNPMKPINPKYTNIDGVRRPETYNTIIDQFDVENAKRYNWNSYDTYCNIFAWDVMTAMGVELPHYLLGDKKTIGEYGQEGAKEQLINQTIDWIRAYGTDYGWEKVTEEKAQEYANMGYPAVTLYQNGKHGHVQVIRPSNDEYDPELGAYVSQAGDVNFNYGHTSDVYNEEQRKNVIEYYVNMR